MQSDVDGLDQVREMERRRVEATSCNDVDMLETILDDQLIYVNSVGEIYDKEKYLRMIRSGGLTYQADFAVDEVDYRVLDDLIILSGVMRGHSRLEGEQQVFRYRSLGVWRRKFIGWNLVAWHSAAPSTKVL